MIKSGAEIIDVGGESTRPGSKTIESKKEWKRINITLKNSLPFHPKFQLSYSTLKNETIITTALDKISSAI